MQKNKVCFHRHECHERHRISLMCDTCDARDAGKRKYFFIQKTDNDV